MHVHHIIVHARYPRKSEEGIQYPGPVVKRCLGTTMFVLGTETGPLKEQQMLFPAEPFLQPLIANSLRGERIFVYNSNGFPALKMVSQSSVVTDSISELRNLR